MYDPAKYKEGSLVRICGRAELEEFFATWKLHHKLQQEQFNYAGKTAKVTKAMMYHGGDMIYQLEDVPGIWHERHLQPV